MSRALPRTENNTRHAPRLTTSSATALRGTPTRFSRVALALLIGRSACGLLAAMHIAPLLRVSRHVLEQGPTPALLATWAVLALLIGVLAARAAGLAFFRAGHRRSSLVALILAAALFHGDALISTDATPTTAAILVTAGAAAVAVSLARKLRESLSGRGPTANDIFPTNAWAPLASGPSRSPLSRLGPACRQPRGPPACAL